ncbi:hypothetical protein DPMN_149598 [Dreissena polymorpha]|uniref:B box-type domain-containing protein n=1 Tax=Dreissena polymorpha TaxID=45954 RepID=A0A9D4FE27_DREPO|nr:hypothetical protein DPMN_149598 [Dreissena polymorpha]
MATSLRSVYKSSDIILDYCCTPCEEDNLKTEAEVYCEKCTTFYCGPCINMHKQLYKKHTTYGRSDIKYWPVAKPTQDLIEKCELHTEEKLKLYCEDHEQICCNTCVSLNHRQCTTVYLIQDAVKTQSFADLHQLFAEINTILQQFTQLLKSGEANLTSMHESYKKSAQDIYNFRQKINTALDELETMTTTNLDVAMITLESDLKTGIDNCSKVEEELNCFKNVMQDISEKNTELIFVASQKLLNKKRQSESLLQRMSKKTDITFSFQGHEIIDSFLSE